MTDMEKMLEEMIKKQAKETIEASVDDYIKSFNIDSVVDNMVNKKLEDKFFNSDEQLEDYIIKGTGKDMFLWFKDNLYQDDILDCIKQAFIEKLKDFTLDELVELIGKTKQKGLSL